MGGAVFGTVLVLITGIGMLTAGGNTIGLGMVARISGMIYSMSILGGFLVALIFPITKFWYGAMIAGAVGLAPLAVGLSHVVNLDYEVSSGLIFAVTLGPVTGFILWILEKGDQS